MRIKYFCGSMISIHHLHTRQGHQGSIYALSLHQNRIFTAGADGHIVEWDAKDEKKPGMAIAKIPEAIYTINVIQDILCAGTASGDIYFFPLSNPTHFEKVPLHCKGIFDINHQHDHFLIAGGNGFLYSIHKQSFTLENEMQLSQARLRRIVKGEKPMEFWIGGTEGSLWQLYKNEIIQSIPLLKTGILSLEIHEPNIWLGGRDALLIQWDFRMKKIIKEINAHTLHIHDIKLSPERQWLVTVSMDKQIRIWDPNDGTILKSIQPGTPDGHYNSINRAAWLTSDTFITVSDDKMIKTWRIHSAS